MPSMYGEIKAMLATSKTRNAIWIVALARDGSYESARPAALAVARKTPANKNGCNTSPMRLGPSL
jgi:hypothetical protein